MFRVVFMPDLRIVEVEEGTSVIEAAEKAGVLIDASCNGNGTCGKCKVKINDEYVLACQTRVNRDMEITIPATHGGSGRKKKMVKLPEGFAVANKTAKNGEISYGVAFDIGTTTVVGMLWNLASGELVDVEARTNYQSLYGADVISRIQYSMQGDDHLYRLQSKVIQCFNDILEDLCGRNSIDSENIYNSTIVGNTTMSHLVWGVSPASMAKMPFAPAFKEAQDKKAEELGIRINKHANVHLLPNIAGHVGSDIVGMMMAARMDELKGSHIAIDIGTNGEVVAIKDGRMLCCSTAAGPAFEGATIKQGMRAAAGAIEKVSIDEEGVHIATIDDAKAVGICGSGLIDAVAELLRIGVVHASGKLLSKEQALEAGVPSKIADCIVGEGLNAYFILDEDIVLTQADIREVQLAKGAILAGIQTLMDELDMSVEETESVMLAGAFGNYIDKNSALTIGLLPQVDVDKIVAIGNAAGVGSCMALLSDEERTHADELAITTEHIELSKNSVFQDYYIYAMSFPTRN